MTPRSGGECTVVMGHGMWSDARVFGPMIKALRLGVRAVPVDFPGHGGRTAELPAPDMDTLAWELLRAVPGPEPVVLERMSLDEDTGEILYRTRPSRADHPEGPVARWDVFELIARVLDHLPLPRQQMVRYWGYYSNASRGKQRAASRSLAPVPDARAADEPALERDEEPFRRRTRLTWVSPVKKRDPLNGKET